MKTVGSSEITLQFQNCHSVLVIFAT